MGGDSGRRLHAFRSLAGNRALVRVLTGYALFVLTEYSAWIAVLVFAYSHGGATVPGVAGVCRDADVRVAGRGPDLAGRGGKRVRRVRRPWGGRHAAGRRALLVPLLVHLGGNRLALIGAPVVLPLAAMASGRALLVLDSGIPVPVVEIALLRSLPLFAELPAPAIEGLAAALTPVHVPAGTVLIQQGDQGDAYHAIAAGELDVRQDGHFLRRCGRGEGAGEIALLRAIPRTASVIAHTPATVYRLNREAFLTTVLGHAATQRRADQIASARLATERSG